ncbi:MAG TPA: ABC transporter permease [Candidatus Limiplasma sp.]|nr:ABC transporter permease [Candidatus Limiplasma sp.]
MTQTHKVPFMRIAKRESMPLWHSLLIWLIGLVLALAVSAIVIYAIVHLNPIKIYTAMFEGNFGSERRAWVFLRDMVMLLCIGIGLAPAFRMRFWNIGAEGQILIGGIATAAVMIYGGATMPTWALLVLSVVVSCIAGAIWGGIPGAFKARYGTNETLFTLMMNYVAIQLTSFFVAVWENPYGSNTVGVINQQTQAGWFPAILGQKYLLNILIVMVLTVAMFIYLRYSKHGYEIAVVGESEKTARYIGINVNKVILRTMMLSGAICGLTGFITVAGSSHTISTSTAGGSGFTAIIVAWLAKFNTFVMILVAGLLVFLEKGAIQIASQYNLNDYASEMITGIILFFILGSEFFTHYRLIFRRGKEVE